MRLSAWNPLWTNALPERFAFERSRLMQVHVSASTDRRQRDYHRLRIAPETPIRPAQARRAQPPDRRSASTLPGINDFRVKSSYRP